MIKRFGTIRWALLLSVGFHAALGWYGLGSTALRLSRPAPLVDQQPLQIVMLPAQPLPAAPLPVQAAPAAPTGAEQKAKPTRRVRADAPTAPALPQPASLAAESPAIAASQNNVASSPAPPGSRAALNLDLGAAGQAAERQRSKSPLAAVVDAQQAQNARSTVARAFSVFEVPSSSIVSETIMSDGTRLVKFSGGGCMRMPNPSTRNHDDVRKPLMENC